MVKIYISSNITEMLVIVIKNSLTKHRIVKYDYIYMRY